MLSGPWFGVRNRIICCRGACPVTARPPAPPPPPLSPETLLSRYVHSHRGRQIIDIYRPRYTHKHVVMCDIIFVCARIRERCGRTGRREERAATRAVGREEEEKERETNADLLPVRVLISQYYTYYLHTHARTHANIVYIYT